MANLVPVLSQIDSRLLIAIAVIAAVAFIWSLAKKAIKAAVVLLVIALLAGVGVPTISNLRENYGINYNKATGEVTFKINGNPQTLNLEEIKSAKNVNIMLKKGMSDTSIDLSYVKKSGTAVSETGSNAVKLPNYMADILAKYLDKAGITYRTIENTGALGSG
ncbi:hypothetical protein FACS1894208_00200 [Clostridia bacterium]|nr:hypothetical protein FACS1894208_00200 [Clostridia bacterium]